MAKTKNYLQMEPIIGDSKNPKYKKAFEIDSWSFEIPRPGSEMIGETAENKPGELHIILSKGSQAIPQMLQALAAGEWYFKEAVLTVERMSDNSKLQKLVIYKMSTIEVLNPQTNYVNDPSESMMQASLRYKRLQYIIP